MLVGSGDRPCGVPGAGPASAVAVSRRDGSTPLHYAAFQGHRSVVAVLLAAAASPPGSGQLAPGDQGASGSLLSEAQRRRLQEAVDTGMANGETALHRAAAKGHVDVLAQLLGCD